MVAGVRDLEDARAAYEPLHAVGYVDEPHRPEIAHHFAKPALELDARRLNLHLTEPSRASGASGSPSATRLARRHPGDVRPYTDGKRRFVHRVLVAAGVEFSRR